MSLDPLEQTGVPVEEPFRDFVANRGRREGRERFPGTARQPREQEET